MQEKLPIKQNILQYLEYKGVTKYQYYKESNTTRNVLDQDTGISEENIAKFLAYAPEVSRDWLFENKGPMLKSEAKTVSPMGKAGIPLIPIDALASQGTGELVVQDHDIEQRYVIPEFSKADYLIRVKGGSMYPKYNPGDILACKRVEKGSFIQWNKTYVLDTTQGVMVKRIIKCEDKNYWVLRSDNKDYQDIDVEHAKDVYNISLVMGVIRLE